MTSQKDIIESAYLRARAEFLTFVEEINKELEGGNVDTAMAIIDDRLTKLPADIQTKSREQHPEQWAALDVRREARKRGANAN